MPRVCLAVLLVTLVTPAPARADDVDLAGVGARAIGRAGVGVVSSDDHAALWYNPAGMARRGGLRAQAGLTLSDDAAAFRTTHVFTGVTPPTVRDRAGADGLPWGGLQLGLGARVIVGAAFLYPSAISYASADPPSYDLQAPDEQSEYPERYAATRFRLLRRGVGVGAAVRALPWLAVGAAGLAFDVRLAERRTFWAGLPGEVVYANTNADMAFTVDAADRFVPAGTLGFVIAPEALPLELGASVLVSGDATLTGTPALRDSRGQLMDVRYAGADVAAGADATTTLPMPLLLRAGLRWYGSRVAAEVDGELRRLGADDPAWRVTGLTVTRNLGADPLPPPADVTSVPLGTSLRSGFALRGAVEVDLVPGFLTVTAGYAFARGAVPRTRLSTAFPDLDAHTFALGVEARVQGGTVTLGIARSELVARSVAEDESAVTLVAPFDPTVTPVGGGRYDGARTLFGLGIELER